MNKLPFLLLSCLFFISCAAPAYRRIQSDEYQEQATLTSSLFKSDQDLLSEEAINRILGSKIVLPQNAKIALMKFPDRTEQGRFSRYGYRYSRSEDYLKLQQSYSDSVTSELLTSSRIAEVIPLPSMMLPKEPSIPILREAAVRLQADLLLVYRITSDIYQEYVLFGKDKVKAYCTCEVVFLDIRTGIIPFTTVVTEDKLVLKEKDDLNIDEASRRAEKLATIGTLRIVGQQMVAFLNSLPK